MAGAEVSIIGSKGFIGSSLVAFLQNDLNKVQLFESRNSYIDDFGQFKENILDSETIVWCASKVNPISAQNNSKLVEDEIDFWKNFIKFISGNSGKSPEIIFLSTGGCIYSGNNPPFGEDAEAKGSNTYGKMKSDMENILLDSGLRYKILRVANVYGLGQPSGRGQGVVAEWINRIKNSEPIEIFGNLENSRDFLHVQDLVLAISELIKISSNQILNIGSGKATKLYELLEIFKNLMGTEFKVIYSDARNTDRNDYWLEISKMKKLTKWQPKINLESGISEILNSV